MKKYLPKASLLSSAELPVEMKNQKKNEKLGIIKGNKLKTMSFRLRPEAVEAIYFMKDYLTEKTNLRLNMTSIVEALLIWAQQNPAKVKKIIKS